MKKLRDILNLLGVCVKRVQLEHIFPSKGGGLRLIVELGFQEKDSAALGKRRKARRK